MNPSTGSIDLKIKCILQLPSKELREILDKFHLNEIYRIHVVFHKETSYDESVKRDLITFYKGEDIIPSLLGSIPLQFQVTLPPKWLWDLPLLHLLSSFVLIRIPVFISHLVDEVLPAIEFDSGQAIVEVIYTALLIMPIFGGYSEVGFSF